MNQSGVLPGRGRDDLVAHNRGSQRSLSPFNPAISYYNAIQNFKQQRSRCDASVKSMNQERPMSSFGSQASLAGYNNPVLS